MTGECGIPMGCDAIGKRIPGPEPGCKPAHAPRSNLDYWEPKLARTQECDKANRAALEDAGWNVLVIWECEVKEAGGLADRVRQFLDA